MGFAKVYSGQTCFLAGQIIDIEIDLSKGLHAFSIVGLPDKAIEEARDRISAAIKNSGFKSPKYKNQKIVISLAPADIKKNGPTFDLAMAIGYLLAAEEIKFDPNKKLFIGELSLDGKIRPVTGVLAIITEAKKFGFKEVYVAKENFKEASLTKDIDVFGTENLAETISMIDTKNGSGKNERGKFNYKQPKEETENIFLNDSEKIYLEEIKGQTTGKRALEIAAAGGHNILFTGPPGTGKTMLAKALKTIMPPLSFEEAVEVTKIYSTTGKLQKLNPVNNFGLINSPPFRSPHHTSSYASIVGGGPTPKPGEMTLAHNGILFLDEFPEFERRVIEALRQPLEEHEVSISRSKGSVIFPARFILVAAMNPCLCGLAGNVGGRCSCSVKDILNYNKKISGPIVDRIDLKVRVSNVNLEKIENENIYTKEKTAPSENVTETNLAIKRISEAQKFQSERLEKLKLDYKKPCIKNAYIKGKDLQTFAPIEKSAEKKLAQSGTTLGFSVRAFHRTWRVARTIADLEKESLIQDRHILEALQFRLSN